jgi:hypothetical protein
MGWVKQQGENKPGTRVDGYSRHEDKKQDLQVSKKGGLVHAKGEDEAKPEARGRVDRKSSL